MNQENALYYFSGQVPALPLFSLEKVEERLSTDCAKYVEVIYANGRTLFFASTLGNKSYNNHIGFINLSIYEKLKTCHQSSNIKKLWNE